MEDGRVGFAVEFARLRARAGVSYGELGAAAHVSRGYLHHVEHGRRWPSRPVVKAIDTALGADGELLVAWERDEHAAGRQARRSSALQADVSTVLKSAASDSSRFAAWAESSSLGATALAMYHEELARLARDLVHRPVVGVVAEAVAVRDRLFTHLECEHQPQRETRTLFVLTGMVCAVLAHACHVLGHPAAGMAQARTARLCAEQADYPELRAWAHGTQALIAECSGRHDQAMQHLRAARGSVERARSAGSVTVRLASYEARVYARLGAGDEAHAAIADAEDARARVGIAGPTSELDEIGGILTFPDAKQAMMAGQASILLAEAAGAERYAQAAIIQYLTGAAPDCSYGDLALSRIDLAGARLIADDLDGVADAVAPVLALPAELRIEPLAAPLATISRSLSAPKYRSVATAVGVRAAIDRFRAAPFCGLHQS